MVQERSVPTLVESPPPPLSPRQLSSLKALVEALLPSLPPPLPKEHGRSHGPNDDEARDDPYVRFWSYDLSSDPHYLDAVTLVIQKKLSRTESLQLKILLFLLSTVIGSVLVFGTCRPLCTWKPFTAWDGTEKTDAMKSLQGSPIVAKRTIFNGIKRLLCALAFSYVPPEEGEEPTCGLRDARKKARRGNPFWEAMGYPGPPQWNISQEEDARRMKEGNVYDFRAEGAMLDISEDAELEFDVVVVGSGSGGGVAAYTLASAGYSVVILEKGPYLTQPQISNLEAESLDLMYEKHSLLTTSDSNIMILAGSALGGGTTINWSCCLETPKYVLEEWVREFKLKQFESGGDFETSMSSVVKRIQCADTDRVCHNAMNGKVLLGCQLMGYDCKTTGQNLHQTGDDSAGFICFGDRYGNKLGGLATYLADAARQGAMFIDNCKVEKVLYETYTSNGRFSKRKAVGIVGHVGRHKVTVRARRCVISAAGSLCTPTLLLRSSFRNRHIGRHLHLHPVTATAGFYKSEEIHGYLGAPLTTVCTSFQHGPRKNGYGAKLECLSAHTGLPGAGIVWANPYDFKSTILRLKTAATVITLQRDTSEGQVTIGEDGFSPRVDYALNKDDKQSMLEALKGAVNILAASGACEIRTAHSDDCGLQLEPIDGTGENAGTSIQTAEITRSRIQSDIKLQSYLDGIDKRGIVDHKMGIFVAHQMCSCRMGASPGEGAIDENGELWECDNLFVFDASSLPTPSGANPMLTTMAMSHMLSTRLVLRLQHEDGKLSDGNVARGRALASSRSSLRLRAGHLAPFWTSSLTGAALAALSSALLAWFLMSDGVRVLD